MNDLGGFLGGQESANMAAVYLGVRGRKVAKVMFSG
jgi:hypothetical protein